MDGQYAAAFVLPSICAPTLCIEATMDKLSNVASIVQGVKGARYSMRKPIIPHFLRCLRRNGNAHDLHIADPEWFNKNVQQFLLEST
jgi:hypothetical protein